MQEELVLLDYGAVDALLETPPESPVEARVLAGARMLALVGFPLVPMLVYLSNRHPGLGPGASSAEQISRLAAASADWAQVHFAFSVGGFLGLASILVIRSEVAKKAPELWTNASAAVGLIGAVIFTGTVLMEVRVIPALARACVTSPVCGSPENVAFTDALANEGWRVLPGLTAGGRTMMLGLALLAILGFSYGALRTWEAVALFTGAALEIGLKTGLHQWGNFSPQQGMPGMAAVLILAGSIGIALRLIRQDDRKAGEQEGAGPAPAVPEAPPGTAEA
ncbi:MAG TPA: hypothetical protein VHI31_07160 [Actinomycetota bacterium]|nr:hypothetical protein [Actinomycetota bacterium]